MERKPCDYCGRSLPKEPSPESACWLLEKTGYGLRLIRWLPHTQPIWNLDDFYQFCSFACAEPMIQDFIKKEKWRVGQHHATQAKEKVNP